MTDREKTLGGIVKKAELLGGGPLGGESRAVAELALQRALSLCRRDDVPEEMEQAVAALAVELNQGGAVQALRRGDVSITYGGGQVERLLEPWKRLGTVAR